MKLCLAITRHAHQHPHQLRPVSLDDVRSLRILPHLKWSVAHELISEPHELVDWQRLGKYVRHLLGRFDQRKLNGPLGDLFG